MSKRALSILLVTAGAAALLWVVLLHSDVLLDGAEWAGRQNPVLFVLAYAVLAALFIPAGPLTMLSGALFGLAAGAAYAFIGAVLAACIAFTASRYLMRAQVERYATRSRKMAAIINATAHQGKRIVFLLRLSPIIPFSLINVTMGVTSISFADFCVASAGMIPVTVLYAYYGATIGAVLALAGSHPHRDGAYWVLLVLGLLATLAVTILVGRIARRAVRLEATASEGDGAGKTATP